MSSIFEQMLQSYDQFDKVEFSKPELLTLFLQGVLFKRQKKEYEQIHIMDISFEDGVLTIPPFRIDDNFEAFARNLMAFEHFPMVNTEKKNEEHFNKYAIQHFAFLDGLISTEKDVSLLMKVGIIINNIDDSDRYFRII